VRTTPLSVMKINLIVRLSREKSTRYAVSSLSTFPTKRIPGCGMHLRTDWSSPTSQRLQVDRIDSINSILVRHHSG